MPAAAPMADGGWWPRSISSGTASAGSRELVRHLTQRPRLRRTPGLPVRPDPRLGPRRSMSLSADLTRWALFAVWEDEGALERFLADSPIGAHWRRQGHRDLERRAGAPRRARVMGRRRTRSAAS